MTVNVNNKLSITKQIIYSTVNQILLTFIKTAHGQQENLLVCSSYFQTKYIIPYYSSSQTQLDLKQNTLHLHLVI